MALTREFKETVRARAARDPAFRKALLTEAAELLLTGDVETGKAVLRDDINATVGFAALAKATGTHPKSSMRSASAGPVCAPATCSTYSESCSAPPACT